MVVFKFTFREEGLYCILDGNGVNCGECFLDLFERDVKVVFKTIIEGLKVVALAPATITMRGSTFHPSALLSSMSD